MKLHPIQRQWTIIAWMLVGALIGGLIAAAGARSAALASTTGEVGTYADNLLNRAVAIVQETDKSLDEANQLAAIPCSADDIANLRAIAFKTRFVKDVGRLINGKLTCSSFLGILSAPVGKRAPDIITPAGRKLWVSVALQLAPNINAMVAEYGVANIVVDPAAFLDLETPPFRYSIAIVDAAHGQVLRSWGKRLVSDEVLIGGDTSLSNEADLIGVRCSATYSICAVAAASHAEAIAERAMLIDGFVGFGGIAGGFLAMLTVIMQRKERPLLTRLSEALKGNELNLLYQPITDLNSGKMISAEALMRWTDNQGNVIAPDTFVAAAEEAGTAGEITAYVLRKVATDAGPFLRAHPELRITVNIVAADLNDDNFYAELDKSIRTAGIGADQIGLELTERSAMALEIAVPAIARLRNSGHLVYLDDFGTGYSSLANLQELNVDTIKIDRAFTNTVGTGSVKVSIVPQILDMARQLNLGIVVEGIETKEQRDYFAAALSSCGGQGWFVSRPLTLAQLIEFQKKH